MKLYISGPMSGKAAFNIPLFDEYARRLRSLGHEVVSPAELDEPIFRELCLQCVNGSLDELGVKCADRGIPQESWGDLLARDVKLLADDGIEGVLVLPEWNESRGAILETMVARLCGLPIYQLEIGNRDTLRPARFEAIKEAHSHAGGHINGSNVNTPSWPIHECGIEPMCAIVSGDPEVCDCQHQGGCRVSSDPARTVLPPIMRPPPTTEDIRSARHWGQRALDQEVRVTSESGGQKGSKRAVLGDICPKALKLLAEVAGFGRVKYDRLNYLKGFEYSLAYDAAQRHLHEFWAGNDLDEESGLPHLAHAAWQCLCLLAFRLRGVGKDDRP